MIETKDVNMVVRAQREGEPVRIKLTHRPTKKEAEGEGPDFDQAKRAAMEILEKLVKES